MSEAAGAIQERTGSPTLLRQTIWRGFRIQAIGKYSYDHKSKHLPPLLGGSALGGTCLANFCCECVTEITWRGLQGLEAHLQHRGCILNIPPA